MRKLRTIMAPIAALAIIATACGSDDTADAPAEAPAAPPVGMATEDPPRVSGGWPLIGHRLRGECVLGG